MPDQPETAFPEPAKTQGAQVNIEPLITTTNLPEVDHRPRDRAAIGPAVVSCNRDIPAAGTTVGRICVSKPVTPRGVPS